MTFEEKIEQWKTLKQSKEVLDTRIGELRKEILSTLTPGKPQCGVDVQLRDLTSFKEDEVYNLMHFKGIDIHRFTKHVVDPSKLEELYYGGDLTDDDLRQIRNPKYVYALVETKDV